MNETDRQEKLRKFLHDLSNKLLPVKLKIDIILEDSPSEDMEFIDKNLEGVIDFIKSFNVDTYEFSDEPRKTFTLLKKTKPEDTASHQALDGEKQTRILIVDDNRDIILNIGSILKRKGFLVSTCDNGQTALGLISSSPDKYNIIITDELMPGMSGSELIPKIQKITPSINIICWSGYFDKEKEDSEKIKYLQKPVSKEKLLNILEGFAEKK